MTSIGNQGTAIRELTDAEVEAVGGGTGLVIATIGVSLALAGRLLVASPAASSIISSASLAVGMLGLAVAIDEAKESKGRGESGQPESPSVPNVPGPIPEGPDDPYSLRI